MASDASYKLTVKTANGSAPDLPINCPGEWSVLDIKTNLLDNHPAHPPVREQKLIYNGALLYDEKILKDIFKENNNVFIHLVVSSVHLRSNSVPARLSQITPTRPRPPTASTTTTVSPSPNTGASSPSNNNPIATPTATPTSQPPNMHETISQEGIRHRNSMTFPQQPVAMPPVATPPFPVNQMMWSNPYLMSPYYAAQMANWYHQATLYHQQQQPIPPGQSQNRNEDTDGLLLENQVGRGDEAGAGVGDIIDPQNQDDDLELPDDMEGGAGVGGAGGFALMADNRRRRDAVDYAYMLMMLMFLISIGYLTGSLYQFMIFFAGVAVILLNQGGWFQLQRRQVRNIIQPQNNPEVVPPDPQPEPNRPEPLQQMEEEGETVERVLPDGQDQEEGGERVEEQQEVNDEAAEPVVPNNAPLPPPPPAPAAEAPRPGPLATIMVFITSFFTSLLPQQIPELQAN